MTVIEELAEKHAVEQSGLPLSAVRSQTYRLMLKRALRELLARCVAEVTEVPDEERTRIGQLVAKEAAAICRELGIREHKFWLTSRMAGFVEHVSAVRFGETQARLARLGESGERDNGE